MPVCLLAIPKDSGTLCWWKNNNALFLTGSKELLKVQVFDHHPVIFHIWKASRQRLVTNNLHTVELMHLALYIVKQYLNPFRSFDCMLLLEDIQQRVSIADFFYLYIYCSI